MVLSRLFCGAIPTPNLSTQVLHFCVQRAIYTIMFFIWFLVPHSESDARTNQQQLPQLLLLLLLLDVLNQFFEGRLAPEHARNGVWAASSCSTAPPLLARRSRKVFSRSCGHFFDAHDVSKKVLKLIRFGRVWSLSQKSNSTESGSLRQKAKLVCRWCLLCSLTTEQTRKCHIIIISTGTLFCVPSNWALGICSLK